MLIVAPNGIINWLMAGRTSSCSSAVFIDKGMTAAELDVENARSIASRDDDRNFNVNRPGFAGGSNS